MEGNFIEIAKSAVYVLFKVSAPPLLSALLVGFIVSLLQALTQIQEQTLSFVPKIALVFLTILISIDYMSNSMSIFFETIVLMMNTIGKQQ